MRGTAFFKVTFLPLLSLILSKLNHVSFSPLLVPTSSTLKAWSEIIKKNKKKNSTHAHTHTCYSAKYEDKQAAARLDFWQHRSFLQPSFIKNHHPKFECLKICAVLLIQDDPVFGVMHSEWFWDETRTGTNDVDGRFRPAERLLRVDGGGWSSSSRWRLLQLGFLGASRSDLLRDELG